jgi:hypothetical protein
VIAGAGFALMAWDLAQQRTWFKSFTADCGPRQRDELGFLYSGGPSTEFYRLIDAAWTCWLVSAKRGYTVVL